MVSATELTASRVGSQVRLHWTTPTHTTDKLLITGPITAVVCRDQPPAAAPAKSTAARPPVIPCSEVLRQPVTPGASDATDPLPAALATGPVRPLAYRVKLLNSAGRTAGPSPAVFALAGDPEPPLAGFRAHAAKAGVVLEWTREPAAKPADPDRLQDRLSEMMQTTVELTRTTLASPPAAAPPSKPALAAPSATQKPKEPAPVRFTAGNTDAGGTIDRTAQIGYTYRYTAQRVRRITVAGNQPLNPALELRSAPTPAVEVAVKDTFPPDMPTDLVASPAFATGGNAQQPAIDLSWEPDVEPRVAGYRVYRREGDAGAWQLLTRTPVPSAAWRDTTVIPGHTYAYRISAVSTAGNESAPSPAVTETAPQAQ